MTIGQIIAKFADASPVQFVHETLLGARSVKAKKGSPAYTRIELATEQMTPNDALYWSGGLGRPDSRKPKYIGIIVWIPTQDYEAATATNAVDPSAQPQERVTPRDGDASSSVSDGLKATRV